MCLSERRSSRLPGVPGITWGTAAGNLSERPRRANANWDPPGENDGSQRSWSRLNIHQITEIKGSRAPTSATWTRRMLRTLKVQTTLSGNKVSNFVMEETFIVTARLSFFTPINQQIIGPLINLEISQFDLQDRNFLLASQWKLHFIRWCNQKWFDFLFFCFYRHHFIEMFLTSVLCYYRDIQALLIIIMVLFVIIKYFLVS